VRQIAAISPPRGGDLTRLISCMQHRRLSDPSFCLIINIADGNMVSLEPGTKQNALHPG